MTVHVDSCPFCRRIDDGAFRSTAIEDVVSFEPLRPVTPGHLLFVPVQHCRDFRSPMGPLLLAQTMLAAATYQHDDGGAANLIVSAGEHATQTVRHLHCHLVPHRLGDGLTLPWTGQA